MINLKLGILYKDNKIVNHRSLLKVLLNPILRRFGYCIGTYSIDGVTLKNVSVFKCNKTTNIKYTLETNEYDKIVKRRIFI